jgi:hypothetical protein
MRTQGGISAKAAPVPGQIGYDSCGEPIANRVLGVDTGEEDHPVNMLPMISQLGL